MNDTQLLSQAGEALYGEHWEAALSREIRISDRSMRRWANGTDPIPWGVWFDIYRHLEARTVTLSDLKANLFERVVIRSCEPSSTEDYDREKDWLIEVHDPESGRHSLVKSAIVRSVAEIKATIKQNPGMMFRVTVPYGASHDERLEFGQMNIERL
jgi:hypothetical protein